jgi:hypothetical protein
MTIPWERDDKTSYVEAGPIALRVFCFGGRWLASATLDGQIIGSKSLGSSASQKVGEAACEQYARSLLATLAKILDVPLPDPDDLAAEAVVLPDGWALVRQKDGRWRLESAVHVAAEVVLLGKPGWYQWHIYAVGIATSFMSDKTLGLAAAFREVVAACHEHGVFREAHAEADRVSAELDRSRSGSG